MPAHDSPPSRPGGRPEPVSRAPQHTAAGPSPRTRRLQLATAAVIVIAGVAWGAVAMAGGGTEPVTAAAPSPLEADSSPTREASPSPTEAGPEVVPGDIVIESGEAGIEVFDDPRDESPAERLGPWTALGSPTTLLGFARESVDGEEWILVELPGAPNHRSAWVRAADAVVTSVDTRIDVYLDEREVEVSVGPETTVIAQAVIGEQASPTPLGVFWVTDVLDFTANPSGVYGAYALGLNGWSETLEEFDGGPPQIALHGTNDPELLGQAASNGCVRLTNATITDIASTPGVGVGTPVVVHPSRAA
ncbi:L,D-transpeptidase family protein [Demequina sp. SO4-18]|uniref:L,D-transpeptidase family protein n=1 Tax=Demequina sp. SO4-18 TaxID=3401026 RepID=UPI003B5A129A